MTTRHLLAAALLLLSAPVPAQELPQGQSEADYEAWLDAAPGRRGQVLSFEAWQAAAGVARAVPTYQVLRTASMWRECNGQPFEVAPPNLWPGMANTIRYIRDHVERSVGTVEVDGVRVLRDGAHTGATPGRLVTRKG